MTIADGPYFYFATKTVTRPTVCEVMAGHVSECGEEGWVPLAMYPGKFIPLVEQPQPQGAGGAGGVDGQHGALTD